MSLNYISGDLLTTPADVIVHQINSLAVKSHGLSSAIKQKFPWADRYSQRRAIPGRNLAIPEDRDPPGSVLFMEQDNLAVACLVGQYEMGVPEKYKRGLPLSDQDTKEQRELWFAECLKKLAEYIRSKKKQAVAFPDHIGCGLAGGDWTVYNKMIDDFSQTVPGTTVLVIRLK